MKLKQLTLLTALAGLLLATASCAKDDDPMAGDKVMVTFVAQLPGHIDSRAIADGKKADELFFWVYDENNHELTNLRQHNIAFDNDLTATVQVPLTPGHTYSFAFWAQNKNCTAYDPNNSDFVQIKYGTPKQPILSNDDYRDAFYALQKNIKVSSEGETLNKRIVLNRVFSQLNYGISDAAFDAVKAAGVDLTGAKVRVTVSKAYTKFGLLAGEPIEMEDNYKEDLVFEFSDIPTEKLKHVKFVGEDGESIFIDYIWLAFNYFLTTVKDPSMIDTSIEIVTADGQTLGPFEFSSKRVQGNQRTNILSDFMTEDATFNVVIDNNFDDYDHVVNLVSYSSIAPSQLTTLNDPNGNYIVDGHGEEVTVNAVTNITANNLVLNNVTLKSEGMANDASPFQFHTKDLTMTNVKFEGAVSGSTDVVIVKGSQANSVTIKDCEFNTQGIYNAIYIDNTPNLNSVLIDNVKFNTTNRNNAITVGNTLDNAMIVVQNCTFKDVSNAMRLFNRNNASGVGLTIKDCVCNKWETNSPQYAGFFIFEDLAATAEAATANNVFGPTKVTVTVDNVIGPSGNKIMFTDPKDGAYQGATANPNQTYYVYYHKGGLIPYGDGSKYPKFIFK